jgi:uncharacterized membrane protein
MRASMAALGVLALGAACCASGIGFVGNSRAQVPGTFALRVCNVSGLKVALALMTPVSPTDNRYHVHGWYIVNADRSGCQDVGSWPKTGYFYWYAQEDGSTSQQYGVWQGTIDKCVATPGPFDRVDTPSYTCAEGEELVKFTEKLIEPKTSTFTLTLR